MYFYCFLVMHDEVSLTNIMSQESILHYLLENKTCFPSEINSLISSKHSPLGLKLNLEPDELFR